MNKQINRVAKLRTACIFPLVLTGLQPLMVFAAGSMPPSLISPVNGAGNVSLSGTLFSWSATAGATSYRLVVSQDPNFSGFVNNVCDSTCFTATTKATSLSAVLSIPGQPYHWKVLANNNQSWSATKFLNTVGTTGKIYFPMEIGQKWTVCQGYNGPLPLSHVGSLINSFDLSLDPASANGPTGCRSVGINLSEGQSVYAPASGKILWHSTSRGTACIALFNPTINSAKSILLGHFPGFSSGVRAGINVSKGMKIANLGTNYNSDGGYAHHHISSYGTSDCTGVSLPFKAVFDDGQNRIFSNTGKVNEWRKSILTRSR